MALLRQVLGRTLRARRERQHRTLREVSGAARVSLGYLSEVERGQKEASSELLASICDALGVPLSEVLVEAGAGLRAGESERLVRREFLPMPTPDSESVPAGVGADGAAGRSAEPAGAAATDTVAATPATAQAAPMVTMQVGRLEVPEQTAQEIQEIEATLRAMAADMERQTVGV